MTHNEVCRMHSWHSTYANDIICPCIPHVINNTIACVMLGNGLTRQSCSNWDQFSSRAPSVDPCSHLESMRCAWNHRHVPTSLGQCRSRSVAQSPIFGTDTRIVHGTRRAIYIHKYLQHCNTWLAQIIIAGRVNTISNEVVNLQYHPD